MTLPSRCVAVRRVEGARYDDARVAAAVRAAIADVGLDATRAHTDGWNPFGALVRPGGTVLVLPNFVFHKRPSEDAARFEAKCTQAAALRPLVELARRAVGPDGLVRVGNAPVQSGAWEAVLEDTGTRAMLAGLDREGARVEAVDLRGWVLDRDLRGSVRAEGVSVDLGRASLLDALGGSDTFRVTHYDPARTGRFHGPGRHVYRLARAALEADLIVSAPKLKTHNKVGVTLSLKGCVGAIAEKDCLAHHRRGDARRGGDEYPRANPLLALRTALGERVWREGEAGRATLLARRLDMALSFVAHRAGMATGGSWAGNDTCWRTAVDIARCLRFADREGVLREAPQRAHVALLDGVVGGDGDGPLAPSPVRSGCVVFSTDPFAADAAGASVMGFDPRRLHIVAGAAGLARYPVTALRLDDVAPSLDGDPIALAALAGRVSPRFNAAGGWRGAIEAR